MLRALFVLLLVLVFTSCSEDVERQIQTDLTVESQQLLRTSIAWGESNYFAMFSFGTYQTLSSDKLPGCPQISIDEDGKTVTLDFDLSPDCLQAAAPIRTGKIRLEYTNSSLIQGETLLTFENYTFGGIQIEGTKRFTRKDLRTFAESSEQLILTEPNDLSHYLTVESNHLVSLFNLRPLGFISTGTIAGTNPAGRAFTINLGEGRPYLSACLESNFNIPISGQETWKISRGQNSSLDYLITFSADSACRAAIQANFPDGRMQAMTF